MWVFPSSLVPATHSVSSTISSLVSRHCLLLWFIFTKLYILVARSCLVFLDWLLNWVDNQSQSASLYNSVYQQKVFYGLSNVYESCSVFTHKVRECHCSKCHDLDGSDLYELNNTECWWGNNPQIFIFIKTHNEITIIIILEKQAENNKRAKLKKQVLS